MSENKTFEIIALILALVLSGSALYKANHVTLITTSGDGDNVGNSVTQATIEAANLVSQGTLTVSGASTLTGNVTVTGNVTYKEKSTAIAATSQYSTTTLVAANSGTTYYQSASGTSIVLPAVTNTGFTVRIVTGAALDTASTTITSAEGDNISGTLTVNEADVACSGEDYININPDLETVGDYIELRSNGTSWYIGDSIFNTAASVTCTDPS